MEEYPSPAPAPPSALKPLVWIAKVKPSPPAPMLKRKCVWNEVLASTGIDGLLIHAEPALLVLFRMRSDAAPSTATPFVKSCDPAVASLPTWQAFAPVPPSNGADHRRDETVARIDAIRVADPEALKVHPLDADAPEEEVFLLQHSFASMLFALFVLGSTDVHRTLVFEIASFTILSSIVAHGLTDTLGANALARWLGRDDAARSYAKA